MHTPSAPLPGRLHRAQAPALAHAGSTSNCLLHLVKEANAEQLLIGNNVGKINGWVPRSAVIGKVTDVRVDRPLTEMPLPLRSPCPYCGKPLATDKAKQCFECGMDWHDPQNVVCHKGPVDDRE